MDSVFGNNLEKAEEKGRILDMQARGCQARGRAARKALFGALAWIFFAASGMGLSASHAQAQERLLRFNKGRAIGEIDVARGQFLTARTTANVGRVVVGNPDVATAVPLTSQSFYVLGRAEGRTNVAVYDTADELMGTVNVEVGADTPDLADSIREVIPRPISGSKPSMGGCV